MLCLWQSSPQSTGTDVAAEYHRKACPACSGCRRRKFVNSCANVTPNYRHSARMVLLVSRKIFMLALVALALDLWHGYLQLSQLYGFAFVFGLLTAFALPASQALLLSSGINRFGTHAKHALPEAA